MCPSPFKYDGFALNYSFHVIRSTEFLCPPTLSVDLVRVLPHHAVPFKFGIVPIGVAFCLDFWHTLLKIHSQLYVFLLTFLFFVIRVGFNCWFVYFDINAFGVHFSRPFAHYFLFLFVQPKQLEASLKRNDTQDKTRQYNLITMWCCSSRFQQILCKLFRLWTINGSHQIPNQKLPSLPLPLTHNKCNKQFRWHSTNHAHIEFSLSFPMQIGKLWCRANSCWNFHFSKINQICRFSSDWVTFLAD